MKFNYDFWYQPRHNVMVSTEWAAPNTFMPGFDLEEVGHLKYGREIHFWDFEKKSVVNTVYLGEDGLVPLEVRFHHNPDSSHGFVGAALSSNIIHWYKKDDEWVVEKVIDSREPAPSGLAHPGARPDQRDPALDGRPLSLSSPTGCTAICANTTSPIRPTRCSPARSGWAACSARHRRSTAARSPAARR